MSWSALVGIFALLIRLALALLDYIDRKGKLEEARARAEQDVKEIAKKFSKAARAARAAVKHDVDSVRNDPANRDRPA